MRVDWRWSGFEKRLGDLEGIADALGWRWEAKSGSTEGRRSYPNLSIASQSSVEDLGMELLQLYGRSAHEHVSSSSSSGNTERGCFTASLAKGNILPS